MRDLALAYGSQLQAVGVRFRAGALSGFRRFALHEKQLRRGGAVRGRACERDVVRARLWEGEHRPCVFQRPFNSTAGEDNDTVAPAAAFERPLPGTRNQYRSKRRKLSVPALHAGGGGYGGADVRDRRGGRRNARNHREPGGGRIRGSQRPCAGNPFPSAVRAPFGSVLPPDERPVSRARANRNVFYRHTEFNGMDNVPFRRREKHRFTAGRKTRLRVRLGIRKVLVILLRPYDLEAFGRDDRAPLDLLPLGLRLVGIVGKIPSRYVDVVVRFIAYFDPIEPGFAVARLERTAVRRHDLVDREERRGRNRARPAVFGKRHVAVHGEHHGGPIDERTRVSRKRRRDGSPVRNHVRAIVFRVHRLAVGLDRHESHVVEGLRHRQHAICLLRGGLRGKIRNIAAAGECEARNRPACAQRQRRPFAVCRGEGRAVRLVFDLADSIDRTQQNADRHVFVRIRDFAAQGRPRVGAACGIRNNAVPTFGPAFLHHGYAAFYLVGRGQQGRIPNGGEFGDKRGGNLFFVDGTRLQRRELERILQCRIHVEMRHVVRPYYESVFSA